MDATIGSDDTGFDAALKALEDLESDVSRQQAPVSPGVSTGPAIEIDDEDPLAAMAAATLAELSLDLVPTPRSASSELCDLDAALAATMAEVALAPAIPVSYAPTPTPASVAPVSVAAPAEPVVHVVAAPAKPHVLLTAAAGMGVFASLLSVIGLVVTSRTVAQASLVVADARERQHQMVQVGDLLHDLDRIRARQLELLQRQQAAVTSTPATKAEMDRSFDALRADLGSRDPNSQILSAVRDGQNELNDRMSAIGMKVSRIEAALGAARGDR